MLLNHSEDFLLSIGFFPVSLMASVFSMYVKKTLCQLARMALAPSGPLPRASAFTCLLLETKGRKVDARGCGPEG